MHDETNDKEYQDFILEFLSLYKSLPATWNIKSKHYYNRWKKNESYEILLKKYEEWYPFADRSMVVSKINSLRTGYKQYLKKVHEMAKNNSQESNNNNEPKLFYASAMEFLEQTDNPRFSINPIKREKLDQLKQNQIARKRKRSEDPTTFEDDSSSQASMNEANRLQNEIISVLDSPKAKRTNYNHREEHLKNNPEIANIQNPMPDVVDIAMVNFWASKLKKMDPSQQIFAEKFISDIIFEGLMGKLHRNAIITKTT